MKVHTFERSPLFGRLHPSYAMRGGRPILRDQPRKWRYLNGFGFQVHGRHIWVELWNHR